MRNQRWLLQLALALRGRAALRAGGWRWHGENIEETLGCVRNRRAHISLKRSCLENAMGISVTISCCPMRRREKRSFALQALASGGRGKILVKLGRDMRQMQASGEEASFGDTISSPVEMQKAINRPW